MIGFLRGKLAAKHPPQLLVDVGGVGYEVEAPMSTFYGLPGVGAEVHLFTHLVVREDAHVLFGFGTERERSLFRHDFVHLQPGERILPEDALDRHRDRKQIALIHTVRREDVSDARTPFGQRAGLVKGDGLERSQILERTTTLHQHAASGSASDTG